MMENYRKKKISAGGTAFVNGMNGERWEMRVVSSENVVNTIALSCNY